MARKKIPLLSELDSNNEQQPDIAAPLVVQEAAYMIVSTIYSNPNLLEQLTKLVTNWLLTSIPAAQLAHLLKATSDSEHQFELFINSLENIIKSLVLTQKETE